MKTITGTVFFTVACLLFHVHTYGQVASHSSDTVKSSASNQVVPRPKGPKPILHEMSGGFRLNTDGWSVYTDIGKVKTHDLKHADMFHSVRIIQIEVAEKKDPKEYKTTSDIGSGNNTYIYGKINNLYALKLGWGYRKLIVGKPDPGSVSIHWTNVGGFVLGMLKPYYLNTASDPNAIKYSDNQENFLDQNVIEGSAGFSKGLSEMKFIPGGHFKSALHFDFSTNRKNVIGVETGFNVEYYSQQIQLMANQPPANYFLDLFIAVQFGRRW